MQVIVVHIAQHLTAFATSCDIFIVNIFDTSPSTFVYTLSSVASGITWFKADSNCSCVAESFSLTTKQPVVAEPGAARITLRPWTGTSVPSASNARHSSRRVNLAILNISSLHTVLYVFIRTLLYGLLRAWVHVGVSFQMRIKTIYHMYSSDTPRTGT